MDALRNEGIKAGVVGLHLYRPFPDRYIIEALEHAERVAVFEKALSYGNEGALFSDIKSALYPCTKRPFVHSYILGLGGREIKTRALYKAFKDLCTSSISKKKLPNWIGLRK